MSYKVTRTKQESFEQLQRLVTSFEEQFDVLKCVNYSEAQLRIDYLSPLLKTLGWDIDNNDQKSQFFRDVLQEEPIDVEENEEQTKKNPDYTLRIGGTRKFFFEAKKLSVAIETSQKSVFQTRRYGWSAQLGVSVLSNFEYLAIYDCRDKPNATDHPSVARYKLFHFNEFLSRFEELYDLISFEAVSNGNLENLFSLTSPDKIRFDDYFLNQIETWRKRLATEIIETVQNVKEEEINYLVQRLLNRIVFLRICEDRQIEQYETLRNINSYEELKQLFTSSDKKYNSGLFDFIEDNLSLTVTIKSETLIQIFRELYYPESPYNFAVIDPTLLSQIYERYLGSKIAITGPKTISIIEEPEVSASDGVVPTPKLVVETIVRETLMPVLNGKSIKEIAQLKIADICCGSGTFLLTAFDLLIETITLKFVDENITDKELLIEKFDGTKFLTLKVKQEILTNNIYGVDINPYAVEVTKFSLLLKLIENENEPSVSHHHVKYNKTILPKLESNIKCGNSLVDDNYYDFNLEILDDDELLYKTKPFHWLDEFPFLKKTKGFDAIIGNPPFVRIQNMVKYQPAEIAFFKDSTYGYNVAQKETFDKYYLFIERAITLLNTSGFLGYIIPNKFFINKGGSELRSFITTNASLFKIIHFGVTQLFPGRSTYTAIMILNKSKRDEFGFTKIKDISAENLSNLTYSTFSNDGFKEYPWIFLSDELKELFHKANSGNVEPLDKIGDITVGVQTSNDKVYIIQPFGETENTYKFKTLGTEFEIEKAICKPCLLDVSLQLFETVDANSVIVFPYTIENGKASVFEEEYLEEHFPLAWKYLNAFKDVLIKRSISGGKNPKWYQFGRSQSLTKFSGNGKIIWQVLSLTPTYVYDSSDLQFTGGGNGPYYTFLNNSQYSDLYIMGIMAHPVFEAMIKCRSSFFRGGYYSHGKQFVQNLPIKQLNLEDADEKKLHDELQNTVTQIIHSKAQKKLVTLELKRNVLDRKIRMLQEKLWQQVNDIYGFTSDDIELVFSEILLSEDE